MKFSEYLEGYKIRRSRNLASGLPFVRDREGTLSFGPFSQIPAIDKYPQGDTEYCGSRIAACFLGNKAENKDLLVKCLFEAIQKVCERRRLFHPEDPTPVTPKVKDSLEFNETFRRIEEASLELSEFLNKYSLPFYSMRYQGHMNWDNTLPSVIGYFTAMLDNPNNVSIQGSTATTLIEYMVGLDISSMIGLDINGKIRPWTHITCDGTVANMESVWSSRELKFLPLAIHDSLGPGEAFANLEELEAMTPGGDSKEIRDMSTWELLNLSCDEILKIPKKISDGLGGYRESDVWEVLMHRYSLGARGFFAFADRFAREGVGMPVVIVPSSKHYSWPKSTFVLGLGYDNELPKEGVPPRGGLINIPVDADARMPIEALRERLIECANYKIPVIQVVAVIGSTEESAIDPLTDILSLRREFRLNNMDFNIHADAAWGGYLLSAIRKPFTITPPFPYPGAPDQKVRRSSEDTPFDVEGTLLSDYTRENMMALRECDSLTIDPHKWGYIPYPAGSLTYRNIATTNLVTFGAPYIGSQGAASSLAMGESGIEGSKPGASAAAVFLSHRILRPDRSGYGQLIQGALFNARVFFIHLLRVVNDYDRGEIDFKPYLLRQNDVPRSFWNDNLIRKFMNRMISDNDFILEISSRKNLDLIRSLGPDQSTLAYAFNKRGNISLKMANDLNDKIYSRLYPNPTEENPVVPIDQFDMFITRTSFSGREYGPVFVKSFADGLGVNLADPRDAKITCLRSVVMDPWMVNTLDGAHDFIGSTLIPALMDAVKDAGCQAEG